MTSKNQTLDLYLEADEGQRLGLFLIHRNLREEFAKIEMAETEAVEDQKRPHSINSGLRHLGENLLAKFRVRKYPATGEKRSTI
jgi:hypothetical protein